MNKLLLRVGKIEYVILLDGNGLIFNRKNQVTIKNPIWE